MILAIDQGTTGTTCLVFDREGQIAGRAYSEFEQHFPRPGWVEHDAAEIWEVTRRVAAEAIAGAGIDVLPQEPPPADHPLVAAWRDPRHPAYHRVILNAHNAFYSVEGLRDMRVKGAEACRRVLLGQPLRNVVN